MRHPAGGARLLKLWLMSRGAALIEDGEPKYPVAAMLAYGWLLLGDYEFYRCNWTGAAKMYRAAFKQEVVVWERSLSKGRTRTQGELTDADRKDIRRHAIEVGLIRLRYLTKARRGVVSPPVRS